MRRRVDSRVASAGRPAVTRPAGPPSPARSGARRGRQKLHYLNAAPITTSPSPAFTRRYRDVAFETDCKTGSAMTWAQRDVTIADPDQRVVEADPFTRLWHTFTPEWASTVDIDEDRRARLATEGRSKVTFEIEAIDAEQVKLTVIHDDLEPGGRG